MIEFFRSLSLDKVLDFVAYLLAVVGSISGIVHSRKNKQSSALAQILSEVPSFIAQIESLFPVGAGAIKLAYVLNEIRKRCESAHIKFDKSYWTEEVEKVLASPTASINKIQGGIESEKKSDEESQG